MSKKEIYMIKSNYAANLKKVKARSLPGKMPVKNWYYSKNLNYSGRIQKVF